MCSETNHFYVEKLNQFIYTIQETISEIHPIYRNDPLNLYVILGSEKAILIDTGCGLYPLKPIVDRIIGQRDLVVINTHAHWDHILGNHEFKEVYIHENEVNIVSHGYSIFFLQNSPTEIVKRYEKYDYLIPPAENVHPLEDGKTFELGGIKAEIIHTPGHSSGSICIQTDKKMLFTGDVAYYGDIFLPRRQEFPKVLKTLSKLIALCNKQKVSKLYPSHRKTPCKPSLLIELRKKIQKIEDAWDKRKFNEFFFAWEFQINDFTFYVSRS
jgi:glyoxylase-like metal-dependent hydrolase (beta-lactamase superfamily II)